MKKSGLTLGLAFLAMGSLLGCQESTSDPLTPDLPGAQFGKVIFPPDAIVEGPAPAEDEGMHPTQQPAFSMSSAAPLQWESDFGAGLNQVDDDCDFIAFGFSFEFFGVSYTGVWVNSNGNLTFDACNRAWGRPDIPDGTRVIIGPLYGDFNPSVGGDVFVNILGTAPDRRFVATWSEVPEFGDPATAANTFQVQLFERTNEILFGYNGLATDGVNWAFGHPSTNANMDVGISSGTGNFINSATGRAIPELDGSTLCYVPVDASSYVEIGGPCASAVEIDIKPGGDPNSINPDAQGVIPVAILTTSEAAGEETDFDATDVDPASVRFGPGGASPAHDLSDPADLALHQEDVDDDGDVDLVLHFDTQESGIEEGQETACVSGLTTDGERFFGCDDIVVLAPPEPREPPALVGPLTSLSLFLNHADCGRFRPGGSTGVWDFFLNGESLGSVGTAEGCRCNANEQLVSFTDRTALDAWNPAGPNEIRVDAVGTTRFRDIAIGYIRAELVTRASSGTFAVFDATGGDASTRNLCSGFVWEEDMGSFTLLLP